MPETGEAVKFELKPSRLAKAPSHRLDFFATFFIKEESRNKWTRLIPLTKSSYSKSKPVYFLQLFLSQYFARQRAIFVASVYSAWRKFLWLVRAGKKSFNIKLPRFWLAVVDVARRSSPPDDLGHRDAPKLWSLSQFATPCVAGAHHFGRGDLNKVHLQEIWMLN